MTLPIDVVIPISLTTKDGQFYHVLKNYKNPYGSDNQRLQVAALFGRFINEHHECIKDEAQADWNAITIVPSSKERVGQHPLEGALRRVPMLREQYEPLLKKGPAQLQHNEASDEGYVVTSNVAGRRVLLADDTFTTGCRVQSAATALRMAGAEVVAAVVAARMMNPRFNDATRRLWEQQRARPFSFDSCCLCTDA